MSLSRQILIALSLGLAVGKAAGSNAFALVIRNRYLLLIGLMLMLFYCVDATGEYILGRIVSDRAADAVQTGRAGGLAVEQLIGRFYSRYFALVHIGSLLLQLLLLVSRIVKYAGVSNAVTVQPALAVLAYPPQPGRRPGRAVRAAGERRGLLRNVRRRPRAARRHPPRRGVAPRVGGRDDRAALHAARRHPGTHG